MGRAKVQICLVSGQTIPSLVPLLDPQLATTEVILAATADMGEQALRLQSVLKAQGLRCNQLHLPDPFDMQQLRDCFDRVAKQHSDIVANVTGGTKPMSIAAHASFSAHGHGVFYFRPDGSQIQWLHPLSRASHTSTPPLSLKTFFAAHGVQLVELNRDPPAQNHGQAAAALLRAVLGRPELIQLLNRYANSLEGNANATLNARQRDQLGPVFEILCRHGMAHGDRRQPTFKTHQESVFARGGWLEEYVFLLVKRLCSQISGVQDLAMNVKIHHGKDGQINNPNELDVVLLRNNTLYVIECKTVRFSSKPHEAKNIIYQLDSIIRVIGGQYARAMLLSSDEIGKGNSERAQQYRINVQAGDDLARLEATLADFLQAKIEAR